MTLTAGTRIGLAGAAVVGVAFGMARYAYGLTLPGIRENLGLSELMVDLVSSATFAGYLAGLLLGGLAVLSALGSWRLVWAGIALAAVTAALVNLRLVPRTRPAPRSNAQGGASSLVAALRVPAAYSVVYFAVVVIYFTYAADALDSGALPATAVPALYAAIGLTGMVGVATGALAQSMGSLRVAALSLVTVSAALSLLGLASDSLTATMAWACIFGVGYMTGSAVLAVWTAELVPDRAVAAFTACLVVGAISSVAAPAIAGAVIPGLGLRALLVLTAAVSLLSGVALMLHGFSRGRAVGRTRS
ncbi:MFS transporter [Kocuria turfanensis]|uniref:Major facilitator superfamily (MFS) profile domain-containing protein n=1 Tax=Kocuria turfanensis TaxID=388357 RepID=A0A512IH38_9MICC|nr:MFS transporter [Kocuria turfanensis]GEO97023.1 hypothetical protein KTU01_31460 [Kocuria turfanensis]